MKIEDVVQELRAHLHGQSRRTVRQDPWLPLTLESEGAEFTAGYYQEVNGDLVPDPVVWVNTDTGEHSIETQFGVFRDAAYLTGFLNEVARRLKWLPASAND